MPRSHPDSARVTTSCSRSSFNTDINNVPVLYLVASVLILLFQSCQSRQQLLGQCHSGLLLSTPASACYRQVFLCLCLPGWCSSQLQLRGAAVICTWSTPHFTPLQSVCVGMTYSRGAWLSFLCHSSTCDLSWEVHELKKKLFHRV